MANNIDEDILRQEYEEARIWVVGRELSILDEFHFFNFLLWWHQIFKIDVSTKLPLWWNQN